jgi:hypothetical protein
MRRSSVVFASALFPIREPLRSFSAGCSALGRRSMLVVSISTRFLRQSWSSCMPVRCDSRGWTGPSSLRCLSTSWPETSPARADNGSSGSSREAKHDRGGLVRFRTSARRAAHARNSPFTHHAPLNPVWIGRSRCDLQLCMHAVGCRRSIADRMNRGVLRESVGTPASCGTPLVTDPAGTSGAV